MAHERQRHLTALLANLSALSPLVGLLGHRQVGKTTLLEAVSRHYVTFDDEQTLAAARLDPVAFLAELRSLGTALDECQLAEGLFPALKERVRKDRRPGQFYLSGSVRFTSKKLIRESLTGRIMSAELLPLTLSELDRTELPDWVPRIAAVRRMRDLQPGSITAKEHRRRMKLIEQYDSHGGLPGVCFMRSPKLRTQKTLDQLDTLLDRDLRQVHNTTLPLPDLIRFLREIALRDGDAIEHQELRRLTGISPITQKKLLFAFEAIFILRSIPIEGDFRGSALFFEDHAEVTTLAQDRIDPQRRWAGLILRNLREQVLYRLGENADFFQYRTRGGVRVPFAIRTPDAAVAFIPFRGAAPPRTALAAAQSFQRAYANGKAVLVTDAHETRVLDDRTLLIPASQLLFS